MQWEAPTPREGCAIDSRNNSRSDRQRELDDEIQRYREAAVSALGQLEWIVGYLHKIKKDEIARALDRNRRKIIQDGHFNVA
jgi:hypothetical protein